jgi:hypothetical protein
MAPQMLGHGAAACGTAAAVALPVLSLGLAGVGLYAAARMLRGSATAVRRLTALQADPAGATAEIKQASLREQTFHFATIGVLQGCGALSLAVAAGVHLALLAGALTSPLAALVASAGATVGLASLTAYSAATALRHLHLAQAAQRRLGPGAGKADLGLGPGRGAGVGPVPGATEAAPGLGLGRAQRAQSGQRLRLHRRSALVWACLTGVAAVQLTGLAAVSAGVLAGATVLASLAALSVGSAQQFWAHTPMSRHLADAALQTPLARQRLFSLLTEQSAALDVCREQILSRQSTLQRLQRLVESQTQPACGPKAERVLARSMAEAAPAHRAADAGALLAYMHAAVCGEVVYLLGAPADAPSPVKPCCRKKPVRKGAQAARTALRNAMGQSPVLQAAQALQQAESDYQRRLVELRKRAFLDLFARLKGLVQQVGQSPERLLTQLRPQWDALRFDYLAAGDLLMDAMRAVEGAPSYFSPAPDGMGHAESAVLLPEKVAEAKAALQPTLDLEFARVVLNPYRLAAESTLLLWLSPPADPAVATASPSPALLPAKERVAEFSSCCG